MRNLSTMDVMHRAIRARVCRICTVRPHGSETLGPEVARVCEEHCPIMINLEKLEAVALSTAGDRRAEFEHIIEDSICQTCNYSPAAGDFCPHRVSRECPLSVHAADALDAIESIALHRQAKDHPAAK